MDVPGLAASPLVSVCLPVFNGERFIRAAIASIAAQTYPNLEIVISDNASTDRTGEICRELADRDPRVRYVRADVNRGLAWNYNRAFALASGQYLVWLASDDVMTPEYVSECVAALESDPGAVIAFSNQYYIDDDGTVMSVRNLPNPAAEANPSERAFRVLWDSNCDPICGVMRMDVLRQTVLHAGYADSDRNLLVEMSLRGRFYQIVDPLFSRRWHRHQVTAQFADRWSRTAVFDPAKVGKVTFPYWRQVGDLAVAIWRAPISLKERLKALRYLLWWCRERRGVLTGDIVRGAKLLGGLPWRRQIGM